MFAGLPTHTAAAATLWYLELCLCAKAAVVGARPAAWAPCEENKVGQGAVKLHKM